MKQTFQGANGVSYDIDVANVTELTELQNVGKDIIEFSYPGYGTIRLVGLEAKKFLESCKNQ